MFTLVPRFILSLRELYARDLQGARPNDIDTAFGFTSASAHESALNTIQFANTWQTEGLKQDEAVGMEEGRKEDAGSVTEAIGGV